MQPRRLEILHGRGSRDTSEVQMKIGDTHARRLRQDLDVQLLLVATVNLANGAGNLAEVPLPAQSRTHGTALLAGKDAVIDFTHQRRAKNLCFDRMAHGFQKA
ncbi:hypothetical protein D3C80_1745240 [compost metagenome]